VGFSAADFFCKLEVLLLKLVELLEVLLFQVLL
jgi:hypothetical protein